MYILKNCMHGYDVHQLEAFYLNCEIHGSWDRGSYPRVGPLDYIVKMYEILFSTLMYI